MAVLRQLARLAPRRRRNDPDVARDAIRFHIRRPHRVDHRAPIGRNLRIGDALHRIQVVERNRMLLRSLCPQGERTAKHCER